MSTTATEALTRIEDLHQARPILGECPDGDIEYDDPCDDILCSFRHGPIIGYSCIECCSEGGYYGIESAECVKYHEHTMDPLERCATIQAIHRVSVHATRPRT